MSYACPKCGNKEKLFVIQATVIGKMPLTDDGFELINGDTTDEIVECKNCGNIDKIKNFTEWF